MFWTKGLFAGNIEMAPAIPPLVADVRGAHLRQAAIWLVPVSL